jgi:hypothetical protein
MKYNILTGALLTVNTTSGIGNKSVDFNKIYYLSSISDTPIITLSGTDKFVVDVDFGHRIHIDRFEYKFIADNAVSSAVASGISFFSKNESFETYTSLSTFYNDSIFYTTVTGSVFAPRYIRFSHTLSGTYGVPTASGSVYGFQVLNDDTIVNFGTDGTKTTDSVETAKGVIPVIKEIPIYNSGDKKSDALVNLEPTFSSVDDVVFISDSEDGPWTSALGPSNSIIDLTTFNNGVFSDLDSTSGALKIIGVTDANSNYANRASYGQYTSAILTESNNYIRFIIDKAGLANHIHVSTSDVVETIEIRSSDTMPVNYSVIRELVGVGTGLYYRDRWLNTQAIKETNGTSIATCGTYSYWKAHRVVYDQTTERWAGYATNDGTDSRSYSDLYIFNNIGTSSINYRISYNTNGGTAHNYSWRELKLDFTGGMWVYFFCQGYHTGDFVNSTGFFLAYFDVNLTNTFKYFTIDQEIGNLDVDYNSKSVWYTKPSASAIYKVSTAGDVQVNYIDENNTYYLGGIAVLPDSNVIFANGKDLHRLKYNGIYLSEYFIEDVSTDVISYITLDGDGSEAIWTIEGMTVGRLYVSGERKGTYDFRITMDYPVRMFSVIGGVWVHCADVDGQGGTVIRFISKENRRVDVSYTPTYNSFPALIYQPYTHLNYTKKMPLSIDPIWPGLSWQKMAVDNFLMSEDQYYQLRLTLRRQEPIERYPEFVTDSNQDFINSDDFNQTTSTPKPLLWSTWASKPALDRVYVNTLNKNLVLTPDPVLITNAYINTSNRVLVGRDAAGEIDVRMNYTIGAGNGIASNKDEYLYITLRSADPGHTTHYASARLYIPASMSSNYARISPEVNGTVAYGSYYVGSVSSLNNYSGELRISCTNTQVIATVIVTAGTYAAAQNYALGVFGENFYIEISSVKGGSQVVIDDVGIYKGYTYYYSDTPLIYSVHKQGTVEIKDIYPNNYKNIYLKTEVPQNLSITPENIMDMKVRWRIPAY